jgi:hypothetical protein
MGVDVSRRRWSSRGREGEDLRVIELESYDGLVLLGAASPTKSSGNGRMTKEV